MNQELHVAVQGAHKKKNILTLINIFACTRETIIYFTLKMHTTIHHFCKYN